VGSRLAGVLTLYWKPSRDESPLLAPAAPGLLSQSSRRAADGYAKLDTKVPSGGSDDPEHEDTTSRIAMSLTVAVVRRGAAALARATLVSSLLAKIQTTVETNAETKFAEAANVRKVLTYPMFCTGCDG